MTSLQFRGMARKILFRIYALRSLRKSYFDQNFLYSNVNIFAQIVHTTLDSLGAPSGSRYSGVSILLFLLTSPKFSLSD